MLENLLRAFSAYQLYSLKEGEKEHILFFNGMHYSVPEKENIKRMIELLKNSLNDHEYISKRVHELNTLSDEIYTENRNRKPIKVKDGFIYLIFCNSTKYYKIGSTKNVQNRVSQLKIANPMIELINSTKVSDILIEKEIHKLYQDKKVSGEWFDLSDIDIENILEYLKNK